MKIAQIKQDGSCGRDSSGIDELLQAANGLAAFGDRFALYSLPGAK